MHTIQYSTLHCIVWLLKTPLFPGCTYTWTYTWGVDWFLFFWSDRRRYLTKGQVWFYKSKSIYFDPPKKRFYGLWRKTPQKKIFFVFRRPEILDRTSKIISDLWWSAFFCPIKKKSLYLTVVYIIHMYMETEAGNIPLNFLQPCQARFFMLWFSLFFESACEKSQPTLTTIAIYIYKDLYGGKEKCWGR